MQGGSAVTVVTKKKVENIKAVFTEYESFTKESGLMLNAEKTEMICFNADQSIDYEVNIDYLGRQHRVTASDKMKVNGIILLQDKARREEENVRKCQNSMERLLTSWSKRRLTLLGRILIIKTFAISQLIFLMQSMSLNDANLKKLTSSVFKYLWNKNYLGNRAPERLKRSIMLTPIKYGGFGMIHLEQLSKSLDLRSYGRLLNSKHPFFAQLKPKLTVNGPFNVSITEAVDDKLLKAISLFNADRRLMLEWPREAMLKSSILRALLLGSKVKDLITIAGTRSLHYLAIHRRVRQPKLIDLNAGELRSVERFLKEPQLREVLRAFLGGPIPVNTEQLALDAYPRNLTQVVTGISSMSSKDIRLNRTNEAANMINIFKIGIILTPGELLSWTKRIKTLSSTRHKNTLLRIVHGDVFSNSRLLKFGLRQSSECANCGEQMETIIHRICECPNAQETWRLLNVAKTKLNLNTLSDNSIESLVGAKERCSKIELSLQAELLLKLTTKGDGYSPVQLVNSVVTLIGNVENLSLEQKENFKNFMRSPLLGNE